MKNDSKSKMGATPIGQDEAKRIRGGATSSDTTDKPVLKKKAAAKMGWSLEG